MYVCTGFHPAAVDCYIRYIKSSSSALSISGKFQSRYAATASLQLRDIIATIKKNEGKIQIYQTVFCTILGMLHAEVMHHKGNHLQQ